MEVTRFRALMRCCLAVKYGTDGTVTGRMGWVPERPLEFTTLPRMPRLCLAAVADAGTGQSARQQFSNSNPTINLMASGSKSSPYKCTFCKERLSTVELGASDVVGVCFLMRPYQCPHCFNTFHRPFKWIGRLPLIGRLFQNAGTSRAAAQPGVLPTREGDLGGPVVRRIAGFGRWVNNSERKIWKAIKAVFVSVWNVIWFIPGKLFGSKKKRGRSKGKFLKPQR